MTEGSLPASAHTISLSSQKNLKVILSLESGGSSQKSEEAIAASRERNDSHFALNPSFAIPAPLRLLPALSHLRHSHKII